ncbi:MAG: hypothetical protein ABIZ95_20840, partial [Pyrinomonadaceae bacterium]
MLPRIVNRLLSIRSSHFLVPLWSVPVLLALASSPALANTYTPNTFADPAITSLNNATGAINGGGTISLRSALKAADNLGGGPHTISLGTGTYLLDGSGTYTTPGLGTISSRTIFFGNSAQNITINGNGPASTIISMAATGRDRIFTINYDGVVSNVVTTINGVKFANGYLTFDTFGGAAIYAGPVNPNTQTLTLNNTAFDNNICPHAAGNSGGIGGAINMFQGTLNIDSSTFTNNQTVDGAGGAIIYQLYNQGGNGVFTVTNSTFTGNHGGENGGAINFLAQGFIVPQVFSVNINRNTFSNNTAAGVGGAIMANNALGPSNTPVINYNRFVGNTSTASAASSGLHYSESAGSVNAKNNWWGCNTGPTAAPCDRAGGDVAGGGSLDVSVWLQLRNIPTLATLVTGQSTTISANILGLSSGGSTAA